MKIMKIIMNENMTHLKPMEVAPKIMATTKMVASEPPMMALVNIRT